MCENVDVHFEFLFLYSFDFNSIEQFFVQLKT